MSAVIAIAFIGACIFIAAGVLCLILILFSVREYIMCTYVPNHMYQEYKEWLEAKNEKRVV